MSERKQSKTLVFLRKNLYYFIVGAALVIIAAIITIVAVNRNRTVPTGKVPTDTGAEINTDTDSGSGDNHGNQEPENPVDKKVVFIVPVENGSIINKYTSSTVAYNKTLDLYTGHMGIDFGGAENAKVLAVYSGTVESIVESELDGITVTINHGNNLKSVYNSLEVKTGIEVGSVVETGDEIGTISDNNHREYKDGAHLHFEVYENGQRIDPNKYLLGTEK